MKLYIDDKILSIIYEKDYEEKIIRKNFTFKDSSNAFNKGSFDAKKIKTICFVKKKKQYNFLYSGFLQDLLLICKNNNIAITSVKDERTKLDYQKKEFLDKQLEILFPFKYIDHQIKTLKIMLKANRGIIQLPTSSGKGDIFINFIKVIKIPTLVIVNRVLLCEQLYHRFLKAGIKNVGICNGKKNIDGDIVISTIQSVNKLSLTKFFCLIGDEIHNFSSETFQKFFKNVSFPIQFGFSATPNKGDKYKYALIRQFFGNVIYKLEAKKLIESEVVAEPYIYFINNKCKPTLDWPSAYHKNIIMNDDRNNKIIEIAKNFNVPILILIKDVVNEQGIFLKKKIKGIGKNVKFISGQTKERNKIINELENGDIDVLISTNILDEGISIKNIFLLIIATGGKSFSSTAQKIGRSLRIKKNKNKVIVVDFTDEENLFTERHSDIRLKIYKKLGFCNIVKIDLEDFLNEKDKIVRNITKQI